MLTDDINRRTTIYPELIICDYECKLNDNTIIKQR